MDTLNPLEQLSHLSHLSRASRPFQPVLCVDGCVPQGAVARPRMEPTPTPTASDLRPARSPWWDRWGGWVRLLNCITRPASPAKGARAGLTRAQRRALQGLDARTLLDIGVEPDAVRRRGASDDARWLMHRTGGY